MHCKVSVVKRCFCRSGNLVLHKTVERIHVGRQYGDIPRGIFVVRGENVTLLGEIDLEKEKSLQLEKISIEEILDVQRREKESLKKLIDVRNKAMIERGLQPHDSHTMQDEF
uniref:U6 snRNA-associated Sm-like protein LSm1 n=2 Tax=Romanomermis culicivorax TaxID=13658 RepID=A0A915IRD9_ROMCU